MSELVLWADRLLMSPYAMSVFVALREKGLTFELRRVDLALLEHRKINYVRQSLTGRVPTLINEGFALSESSAISEYLEETFAAPRYPRLYPLDPKMRARCRQVQAWLRSDFMPIRQERSTEVIFRAPTTAPLSIDAQASVAQLYEACETLLPKDEQFLFGQWSIADTDLAIMLSRLLINGDAMPQRLAHYAKLQWQRETVQAWIKQPRQFR